jgi:PEP-CTERM motif
LTDAYVLGTTITSSDFVSWTYDGSNLFPSYTVDSAYISGALPTTLPGPPAATILIEYLPHYIQIGADGDWETGLNYGAHDSRDDASFSSAIPEPSTWAMALLGFGARIRGLSSGVTQSRLDRGLIGGNIADRMGRP